MTAKSKSVADSLSAADRLERTLDRLQAAQRKQMKNEDIVRRGPNGELNYERIRTFADPNFTRDEPSAAPNNFPEPPASPENGKIFAADKANSAAEFEVHDTTQAVAATSLESNAAPDHAAEPTDSESRVSFHGVKSDGKETASDSADPLDELLARALSRPRRGRPAAFDERNKGQLVALLSLGMSLRQAAAVLGVSHTTIRNTLKSDATLAEEITAARFQSQLQPLACVIREARRSWKAATWLLKYLDSKIASHEETPDERRDRQERESDEFFSRARSRSKPGR